jgi:hypothetical protein
MEISSMSWSYFWGIGQFYEPSYDLQPNLPAEEEHECVDTRNVYEFELFHVCDVSQQYLRRDGSSIGIHSDSSVKSHSFFGYLLDNYLEEQLPVRASFAALKLF